MVVIVTGYTLFVTS